MNFAFCAALSRRSPSRSLPLCFCFVVIVGGQCIDYRREQGTLLHSPAWLHHHPLPFPSPSLRLPLHDDDNDVASGWVSATATTTTMMMMMTMVIEGLSPELGHWRTFVCCCCFCCCCCCCDVAATDDVAVVSAATAALPYCRRSQIQSFSKCTCTCRNFLRKFNYPKQSDLLSVFFDAYTRWPHSGCRIGC